MKFLNELLLLFFFLIPILGIGANKNYYLDLKKGYIEVGEYLGENFKRTVFQTFDRTNLDILGIKNLLIDKDEKVLFYIHSMFGGVHFYHKNSLDKLSEFTNLDKTISIIWHVDKMSYKGAWDLAPQQGDAISALMSALLGEKSNEHHLLCHSMGHRIFEGMAEHWISGKVEFKTIILAAADLDIDIFEKRLMHIPKMTNRLIIYSNANDRLLKISSRKLKRERLGLHAHESKHLKDLLAVDNLEIVNVTQTIPGRKLRYTNHIYFKNNPRVLADINQVINRVEGERGMYFELQ